MAEARHATGWCPVIQGVFSVLLTYTQDLHKKFFKTKLLWIFVCVVKIKMGFIRPDTDPGFSAVGEGERFESRCGRFSDIISMSKRRQEL